MTKEEYAVSCNFDTLFLKNVPHILEKIFFSLDYKSFKKCLGVSSAWNKQLASATFIVRAKPVFDEEIKEEQSRLVDASEEGDAVWLKELLSSGMLDVDCVAKG